ncbi:MAG TPA: hypothetical protein VGR57_21820 [Ktedonobacterales bacterium]|nr:hypothetical protein [Ktedonobacterales bacterium]
MLEDWIALVQAIARLPADELDALGEWLRSRARAVERGGVGDAADALALPEAARALVARLQSALQDLQELPAEVVADLQTQAVARGDHVGAVAAKALAGATQACFSLFARIAKTVVLIRDLLLLPQRVVAEAVILLGEAALPAPAALAAIDWLEGHSCTVCYVEAWRPKGSQVSVVDTSVYESACASREDWPERVACCAQGARDFIAIFSNEADILFNCYWQCPPS